MAASDPGETTPDEVLATLAESGWTEEDLAAVPALAAHLGKKNA